MDSTLLFIGTCLIAVFCIFIILRAKVMLLAVTRVRVVSREVNGIVKYHVELGTLIDWFQMYTNRECTTEATFESEEDALKCFEDEKKRRWPVYGPEKVIAKHP